MWNNVLSVLSGAGNLMDLPGSSVRDVLAGRNPFDQYMTPFSDQNRTTGRQLARDYGMAGDKDTWGNYLGGMAAETLLDPTSYIGVGLANKALKGAKGAVKNTMKVAANPVGDMAGMARAGKYVNTLDNTLAHKNYMATANPPVNRHRDFDDILSYGEVADNFDDDVGDLRGLIDASDDDLNWIGGFDAVTDPREIARQERNLATSLSEIDRHLYPRNSAVTPLKKVKPKLPPTRGMGG